MTPQHRTRARTAISAALTASALTLVFTSALGHPGRMAHVLITLTAVLGATAATLALAAAFAPTTATRTAAGRTLDLLLRLVPWYTPRG